MSRCVCHDACAVALHSSPFTLHQRNHMTQLPRPPLKGQKALVVGIANESSIAYGCAAAFHQLEADLAVTYLNDKAKPHVEPLAHKLGASIFMPLDVAKPGELEALFERIAKDW